MDEQGTALKEVDEESKPSSVFTTIEEGNLDSLSFNRDDPEWEDHLTDLITKRDEANLNIFLRELYDSDIAHFINRLDEDDAYFIFHLLDREVQGEVLLEIEESIRDRFLERLSSEEIALIVAEQQSDNAADILGSIEPDEVHRTLSNLPDEDRVQISELLSYPENSAGALMAKEFVAVQEKDTVKKAIQRIRVMSRETDDIYMVYVVDDEGHYKGHIDLRKLILARPQTKLRRIMESELLPIPPEMDQEEVANFFTRYDFISTPVVDQNGILIGRITVDDILDVIREEASEDILRMSGVSGDETLGTPILTASRRRIVWLIINLLTAFIASWVVSLFSATISQVVILAALMPIVAGMGGNAATQTMAVIIRNIAIGELTFNRASHAIRREMTLGLFNGIFMGTLTGSVLYILDKNFALSLIIGCAMLVNMSIASTTGTIIPLVLKRLGVDPAVASGIFVTTFTDVFGFMTFLGLATLAIAYLQ